MKRIMSLTLALALTAALFTGCGCAANVSTHPGGMITEESTRPSVMPHPTATHETTRPTQATRPQATEPSITLPRPTDPMGTEGTGENSAPTDATIDQRGRNHSTAR